MSPSDLLAPTARPHIPPPDIRRPETMQRLPEWVASRLASLKDEYRREGNGNTAIARIVPTLPPRLVLKAVEREVIEDHMQLLNKLGGPTPIDNAEAEAVTLVAITEMMLVKPAARQNETSAEARGKAYMEALDDLPPWTVHAAIRRWNRGDVGKNPDGTPLFDCHWAPESSDLRALASAELLRVQGLSKRLGAILAAEPAIEFSDDHCAAMRARLATVFESMAVGFDGSAKVIAERRSTA
jgi:hypothetical protein